MKCITHVNREAECYCPVCKQPICWECRDYLGGCINCAEKTCKDTKMEILKTCMLSIVIPIVLVILFRTEGMLDKGDAILPKMIIIIILSAFVPFGWSALNRITPNIFLILPIVGWVIFFITKFFLSMAIGWIIAIPKCISIYKSIKVNEKIERNIKKIKSDLKIIK